MRKNVRECCGSWPLFLRYWVLNDAFLDQVAPVGKNHYNVGMLINSTALSECNFIVKSTTSLLLLATVGCATYSNDRNGIDASMRQRKNEYRGCYEREFNRSKSHIEGKIVAAFYIEDDGSVTDEKIASSTMNSPAVETCILKVIKTSHFQSHTDPRILIKYPFEYSYRVLWSPSRYLDLDPHFPKSST